MPGTGSGILLLDKPAGLSSNAALQRVKRLLGAHKAGHVGSLDPLATGMLPIVLEEATKVAGEIISARKCYRFTLALGSRTRTGDAEGEVVETQPLPPLERQAVEQVFAGFLGRSTQVPPMYSALKRDGRPLYALARAGIEVEREARPIELLRLDLLRLEPGTIEAEVVCSKGTYVRTLGEDIAQRLGTCGHLSGLRRLYVEPFEAEAMQTLEQVEQDAAAGRAPKLLPLDMALAGLPAVTLDAVTARRLLQGQRIAIEGLEPASGLRLYGPEGSFLGLGRCEMPGVLRARRLLSNP